ncbi:hypothetical protein CBS147333_9558 [Penicillium roqueforti]|nr:hypothetical protein CBS147372_8304 [Penicillium roqueforti]KAI3096575.1 hypothetical protein CBS147333_9558 [Penicillium roqueforti]KAI3266765.1 hypothetical protein CBS147308_6944 [Penicillium roqueforti]KAI3288309.1 hypothetical protein DTO003C3_5913 [Penicillium roqueforti]
MAQIITLVARELLLETLPPLLVGPNHTNSSAIHKVDFVGQLMPWPNFEREVIAALSSPSTNWSTDTLDVRIVGPGAENSMSVEQLVLGDETGLQGRLNERLGRPVTASLQAQHHHLRAADFKASAAAAAGYTRVPDMVMLNDVSAIKVIGEVKTPWPGAHCDMLSMGVQDFEIAHGKLFRRRLGQVSRYMKELNTKHAFLSTYDKTIFLRKVDIGGVWTLQFSPVIQYDRPYNPQTEAITAQKGLFYLALLRQSEPAFTTRASTRAPQRNQKWTVSRERQ